MRERRNSIKGKLPRKQNRELGQRLVIGAGTMLYRRPGRAKKRALEEWDLSSNARHLYSLKDSTFHRKAESANDVSQG